MDQLPKIEFATARSGRIAYQRFGEGSEPIVAVPPSAQNIEVGWDQPDVRRMLERFATFSDYVHFDKLGTGGSDRSRLISGVDERVDDLRAVMDSAGIESAHLFAQSEGGPWTLLFAATYPHRVKSLILFGSTARMTNDAADPEDQQARHEAFAAAWGTPDSRVVDLFAPSKSGDAEYRRWHQRYERLSASSDSILDLLRMNVDLDVREVLPALDVPVLVLHRRNDAIIPLEWGEEVADLVSNAQLIVLDGADHFAYLGELD
ncbi:MAG: alpha/beta fold hydrolase, partial [Acidimicrobiia bacterium]